jgi:hypothetical protein
VHPPGKDTSFNRNLTRNDGLLADHIAKRLGIPFDQAAQRIAQEVEQWRMALQRHGRLELPAIGIFYHDAEHILQFDPDKRSDHLKDSFGLRPVPAIPIIRQRETPVIPITKALPTISDPAPGRSVSVAWAAAGVAALLFLVGAVWMGGHVDRVQWSALLPFQATERTYQPVSVNGVHQVAKSGTFQLPEGPLGIQLVPLTEGDTINMVVDLGSPMNTLAEADTTRVVLVEPRSSEPVAATSDLRFHVIGGCFAQPENAERFLAELKAKGFQARQLPKNGDLYPVAYGSYAARREALQALEVVRNTGSAQAWLLVR